MVIKTGRSDEIKAMMESGISYVIEVVMGSRQAGVKNVTLH